MKVDSQNKILDFLTKNKNLVLIVILIFAFYLRFKYLNINTAIWWDEGEYLSIAKEWTYGINYDVPSVRQPLVPFLISILYRIGISSLAIIKFFVVLIPSVASVLLTYLLGKEIYNKNVGLISSFIMSVFWVALFWSSRVSTDLMGLSFSLLAFWAFWKGYEKKINPKLYLSIVGIVLALGFTTRVGNVLAILILGTYLVLTVRLNLFKEKPIMYLVLSSVIAVIPYLIWNQLTFGNIFAFWGLYFGTVSHATSTSAPFFWGFFNFFKLYLFNTFFIFFILGLLLFYKVLLGFDIVLKRGDKKLLADFFVLLMIIIPTIYFVFIQRQVTTEPRWAMIMAPAIFFTVANGLLFLQKQIVKYLEEFEYKKILSLIVIVIIVLFGGFSEINHADNLIQSKKDSYLPLKFAGEWIKENSNNEDIVFSSAVPQNSYYSERRTITVHGAEEKFNKDIAELKPKFLEITPLEGYPEWAWDWPARHQDLVKPIRGYFIDEAQTQPILIVYQFIDYPNQESNTIANVDAGVKEGN